MSINLSYASRRSEIWTAYKARWKAVLWKYHFAFVLGAVLVSMIVSSHGSSTPWMKGLFFGLGLCGVLAMIPQIMFKPQTRTISFDEKGFTTKIGTKSGERSWEEIERIEDSGNLLLIVGKTQSMMAIPDRAFQSHIDRSAFLEAIRNWHGGKSGS